MSSFLGSDVFPQIMKEKAMNEEFLVGLTGEFWTEIQGIENTINKVLNLVAQSFAVELCRF